MGVGNCEEQRQYKSEEEIPPILSYQEAMNLARNGLSFYGVVETIRFELLKAQRNSPANKIDMRIDLAVALMESANNSPNYDVYNLMYRESENILLTVLQEQPRHKLARENLALVRRNKATRPEPNPVDAQTSSDSLRTRKSPSRPNAQVSEIFRW